MTQLQTDCTNGLFEMVQNEPFSVNRKTIVQNRKIRLHRRGVLCIKKSDGYMGRVLFNDTRNGQSEIISLNVSIPWEIQKSLPQMGRLITKDCPLSEDDLALRGVNLRLITGKQDQQLLIATPGDDADNDGIIQPYEVTHGWNAQMEQHLKPLQMEVQIGKAVRRTQEVQRIAVYDFGETEATWSVDVQNRTITAHGQIVTTTVELAQIITRKRYVMGIYNEISEEVLSGRISQMVNVCREVAVYREETVKETVWKKIESEAIQSFSAVNDYSI